MGETNWMPGLIALAAGILAGGLIMLLRRKGFDASPVHDIVTDDLVAERTQLVAQLQALHLDGEVGTAEQSALRYDLELRCAEVSRDLARRQAEAVEAQAAIEPRRTDQQSTSRGFIWGLVAAAGLLLPIVLVTQFSAERREGGSLTGGANVEGPAPRQAPMGSRTPPADPVVDRLKALADADEADLGKRLELAKALIGRRRLFEAFGEAKKVLGVDPENARANAYSGVIQLEMGRFKQAVSQLQKAATNDPSLVEAWMYLGIAHLEMHRPKEAIVAWDKAIELRPDAAQVLTPLRKKAQLMAEGKLPPPGPTRRGHPGERPAGHPGAHPPRRPASHPTQPSHAAIHGTVTLRGGTAKPGAVLFIFARAVGQAGGPPIAAKRIVAKSLPLQFTLGQADSMMGRKLPAKVRLQARLDPDGNPTTKEADAPQALLESVALGEQVTLDLK
jgi:tetratricopeptide (TPR) repeat protein